MGRIIDNMKAQSKRSGDMAQEGLDAGAQIAETASELGRLIKDLPEDVDDEILAATREMAQAAREEAAREFSDRADAKLKEADTALGELESNASDQISVNDQTSRSLNAMDSVGKYGSAARESAKTAVDHSTGEINTLISGARTDMDAAREQLRTQKEKIDGAL